MKHDAAVALARWAYTLEHTKPADGLYPADWIINAIRLAGTAAQGGEQPFQHQVQPWMDACFGPEISSDKTERNHRFLEETLELVQATGCTEDDAHALVRYVYGRPVGEPGQEVGGVMVTLAALCLAQQLDMHLEAAKELARIWLKVPEIRAKHDRKPRGSALPGASA